MKSFNIYLKLSILFWGVFCLGQKNYPNGSIFTPIQLQPDSTHIYLQDFLPNLHLTAFNLTHRPKGVEVRVYKNFELIVYGEPNDKLSYIGIDINGSEYALPLFKSELVPFTFEFKADRKYNDLKVKGTFNNWNADANPLKYDENTHTYSFTQYLMPGNYEYVLIENGKEFPDPNNPNSISNGMGGVNSIIQVGEPKTKKPFITTQSFSENTYSIKVVSDTNPLNYLVLLDNTVLPKDNVKPVSDGIEIELPVYSRAKNRMELRVFASDGNQLSNDILVPISYRKPIFDPTTLSRKDMQSNVMYSVFVDRFYNGNPNNDQPLNREDVLPAADWHGGDLEGVIRKVGDDYFTELGINNLWISPIIQNPKGPYGHMQEYGVDTKFAGYHGYWPISSSKIDERFGTESDLTFLIKLAHEKKMNVLLDYVANHVHEEHPLLKEHPDWKTNLYLSNGEKNIRLYDQERLTTWFDEFMPTLNLERTDVADVMTDSAVYWFKKFDIDGFRHDATKHIPNSFWRLLTYKLKRDITLPQDRSIYQIGETYGTYDLVNSYVNTGMLDAQFDFNLYDKIKWGLMAEDSDMAVVADALNNSLQYYGYHNLMGNISGNHDKGRIISYADGSLSFNESAKEAGYTRKIKNKGRIGYEKVAQLMAFNMVVPGIPVIYYGDEIGMPGGDDPDNRRDMVFDNLNANQQWLKNTTAKLAKFRRKRMELMYGDTKVLFSDKNSMVILRTYFGENTILVLNNSGETKRMKFQLPKNSISNKYRSFTGSGVETEGDQISINVQPYSFQIAYNEI